MTDALRKLLIGTGNPKKRAELEALLAGLGVQVLTPAQCDPVPPSPPEDEDSFEGNAQAKATAYAQATGLWALADDSGLCVDALDGRPGVHSARYAGADATDEDNVSKLLEELGDLPASQRGARFVCALCLAAPSGSVLYAGRGEVLGQIIDHRRGRGGFGYDPVFQPHVKEQSFAELSAAEKHALSHRGRALTKFKAALPQILADAQA